MLYIYLLRHGQTQWNADSNRYCGRSDIPLTSLGVKQAENVREQLKNIEFKYVYSSPLQRAYTTAKIAANDQRIIIDERLIESDFGQWENKTKEEFIAENETLWRQWCEDPMTTKAGGTGETAGEVIRRVEDFFTSLINKHEEGNVLVVAHNGVNRLYLAYKLGMPVRNYRKIFMDNSTVSMFQLDWQGELTLIHLNSTF
jgi:broad specificity phosphatase PhoE